MTDTEQLMDLNTYKPPKELQSMQVWTLVLKDKRMGKVSEYNYTKKKMPLLSWPGVMKRYNRNPNKYEKVAGFVTRDIMAIDIDVKKTQPEPIQKEIMAGLPTHIKELVELYPTFYHRSKSGNGWRIYYRTDTPIPKMMVPHKRNKIAYGEIFQGMFVTTTDPLLSDFTDEKIATIRRDQLAVFMPEVMKELQPRKDRGGPKKEKNYLDYRKMVKETERILSKLPVDPDLVLETAYETQLTDFECTGYHHWLLVSHALADLVYQLSKEYDTAYDKFLSMFAEWSSTGQSFVSVEDCEDRFERSYNETVDAAVTGKTIATFQTLRKLFWGYKIPVEDFPIVKVGKDGHKAVDVSDPANYTFLTNALKIKPIYDYATDQHFLMGPTTTIKEFFCDEQPRYIIDLIPNISKPFDKRLSGDDLNDRLVEMFRRYGMPGVGKSHPIRAGIRRKGFAVYDLLLEWMRSRPWDGQMRAVDLIEQTIEIEERKVPHGISPDFYYLLIFKHLILTAGLRARAFRLRSGQGLPSDRYKIPQAVLVLAGYQNTRKSTWITSLLPQELTGYVKNVTPSSVKDGVSTQRLLSKSFVFNIDEIDASLTLMDLSDFKNMITQGTDTYRDLYESHAGDHPRSAGMFGTTNSKSLRLDRTGNRRFWIVPVKMCDARPFDKCDYQQVWAELLHYADTLGIEEWSMTEQQKDYVNRTAAQYTAKTAGGRNLDTIFADENGESLLYDHESFDFDGLFTIMGPKLQRLFSGNGLFFARRGNKAYLHLQAKIFTSNEAELTLKSFEHELTETISFALNKINTTSTYKLMTFIDGVVQFYSRGIKNKPQYYHFIPYRDKLNLLRAKGQIPDKLFLEE